MKDTLGSQGVQVLLKRMKEKEEKTKKAEEDGKSTENGETLKNYDSEMNNAFNKSKEAEYSWFEFSLWLESDSSHH